MDTIIEQYLKGHFSLEKQKEILHYIQVNKELKNRLITMAILVRSINNVGYKKNIEEKIKKNICNHTNDMPVPQNVMQRHHK